MSLQNLKQETTGGVELLTTREAAAFLKVAPQTLIAQRVRGGGPPFIKLGNGPKSAVRYNLSKVVSWLEEQSRENTSQQGVS
jgi:hypothetical protein